MWDTDNKALNGPFEPWLEERDTYGLEVQGTIPAELDGALFRTSSNQHLRPPDPDRQHWFDGDGMIFGIFLRDGRATCTNRWVESAGFKVEVENGKAVYGSNINGGVPISGRYDPAVKNPANTNVTLFDDRLLVFSEIDVPHELHAESLKTFSSYDFHGSVKGPVTAHFKIDPRNGDMLFFGYAGRELTWYHADQHGTLLGSYHIDMGVPSFIHDFVVTEDYAIFLVNPGLFLVENIIAGRAGTVWDPAAAGNARFAVMSRHTGKVTWFDGGEPFAPTHFYNAYQDGPRVIVDGHRTPQWGQTPDKIDVVPPGRDWNQWFFSMLATPWRWELNMKSGGLTDRATSDIAGEFPRINDDFATSKHRYGYFCTTRGITPWLTDGLAKHDYELDQTVVLPANGLISPSEPVFVPRSTKSSEHDGWLLTVWWDAATGLSELLIHDAEDFGSEAVARIKLGQRLPSGFHGNWVTAEAIEASV